MGKRKAMLSEGTKQSGFTQKGTPDLIKLASIYTVGSVEPRHHEAGSHGYGHGVERRDGKLRLSGNKLAHRIGKK